MRRRCRMADAERKGRDFSVRKIVSPMRQLCLFTVAVLLVVKTECKPTLIVDPPRSQTVNVNDPIVLQCGVSSDPAEKLTVEWRRDGRVIDPSGESARLTMDPLDHSLTIRYSLVADTAQYTCHASNGLDSDNSFPATVIVRDRPAPPRDVVVSCTATLAEVSWTPGNDNNDAVFEFIVYYRLQLGARPPSNTTSLAVGARASREEDYDEETDTNDWKALVEMRPWTSYAFYVTARNGLGESELSDRVQTSECRTPEAPPSRNPDAVCSRLQATKQLVVTWVPIDEHEYNGRDFYYLVSYKLYGSHGEPDVVRIDNPTSSEITIHRREVFRKYEISVQSANTVGKCPEPVRMKIGYSGEGTPMDAPQNFRLTQGTVNSTYAEFSWDPVDPNPDRIQGFFRGYRIIMWRPTKPNDIRREDVILNDKFDTCPDPSRMRRQLRSTCRSGRQHRSISDEPVVAVTRRLWPYSKISAVVVALNSAYEGNRSEKIEFETPEGAPPNVGNALEMFIGDPTQTTQTILELESMIVYRISVSAATVAGRGDHIFVDVETLPEGHECVRTVMTTTGGFPVEFPDSVVDAVATSLHTCIFDGEPLALAKCMIADALSDVTPTTRQPDPTDRERAAEWIILYEHNCASPVPDVDDSFVSKQLADLYSESALSSVSCSKVSSQLARLTSNVSSLTWLDVVYTSGILSNIVLGSGTNTYVRLKPEIAEHLLTAVDSVARVARSTQLQAQKIRHSISRIVSAVTALADSVQLPYTSSNLTLVRPSVVVQAWNLPMSNSSSLYGFGVNDLTWETDENFRNYFSLISPSNVTGNESVILLSDEALNIARASKSLGKNMFAGSTTPALSGVADRDQFRVSFTAYRSGDFFAPSPTENGPLVSRVTVNSLVLSASLPGVEIANLTQPITVILRLVQPDAPGPQRCAFWDESRFSWSTDGVSTDETINGGTSVVCRSRHLTNFAVIAGYDLDRSNVISAVLEAMSIIGLSLSIAGLSLTIISQLIAMKYGRKGRAPLVLLHLSIAVLSVDIIVLAGVDKTGSEVGCKVVAALLLYFLLVSFSWMLVEAVLQYLRFVKVLGTYTERFTLKAGLPAWIIPGVIVSIVVAVDFKVNMLRGPLHYCWLSPTAFYSAFLVPLGLVMIANIVLFILIIKGLVFRQTRALQSTQNKNNVAKLQAFAIISCFIVMGLTWLFAFFAIDRAATVMQFLFCIFNSLQGFLIFMFLNVREPSISKAWRRACSCCCRPSNETQSSREGKKSDGKDTAVSLETQRKGHSKSGLMMVG